MMRGSLRLEGAPLLILLAHQLIGFAKQRNEKLAFRLCYFEKSGLLNLPRLTDYRFAKSRPVSVKTMFLRFFVPGYPPAQSNPS